MKKPIPTYIINLKKRVDRKKYILKEFAGREEFDVHIVEAQVSEYGALGLWNTMKSVVQDALKSTAEYIIICEDDHKFTKYYTKEALYAAIDKAQEKELDLLFGGVSWFSNVIKIDDHLFWLENFSGTQFFVIFRKFFSQFLTNNNPDESPADARMGEMTSNKAVFYPFISTQKEFGYSDATIRNNEKGRVNNLFKWAQNGIKTLETVRDFYKNLPLDLTAPEDEDIPLDNFSIPTYVINLPERKERLEHILNQFAGKPEFQLNIIKATKHKIGAVGLWKSIRKVIKLAIKNDDDVIIICEDDHTFTEAYSKKYLLENILQAHAEGACFLSGGTGKFGYAMPIAQNRFWTNHCLSAQFLVIYKSFFQQILDEPFDKHVIADMFYSRMTSNKLILYPFISTQREFGYSDVTPIHHEHIGLVGKMFTDSAVRLQNIQNAYLKFRQ